uniref:MADF domain-containing protein n=1 Tax=Steinernema glaseri TaxID=37863 RepID=A0A1I7ZWM6_9BILA
MFTLLFCPTNALQAPGATACLGHRRRRHTTAAATAVALLCGACHGRYSTVGGAAAAPSPPSSRNLRRAASVLLTTLEVVRASAAVPTSSSTTYRIIELKPQPQSQDSKSQLQQLSNHSYEATAHGNTNPPSSAASRGPGAAEAASTERGSWANNDEFTRRLIGAVRKQPSLYNPNHEHYGNKHTNSQIRNQIWAQLCDELGFPDGAQQLQTVWKRIRDRYVRERRKRRQAEQTGNAPVSSASTPTNNSGDAATISGQNAACRHFDSMRWIDAYIFESNSTNKQQSTASGSTASSSSQVQRPSSETMYYTMQSAEQSTGDMNYQTNHQDFLNVSSGNTGNSTLNFAHNGSVLDISGSPCSSTTSSEISVGSTSFTATASSKGAQQQQQQSTTGTTVVSSASEGETSQEGKFQVLSWTKALFGKR